MAHQGMDMEDEERFLTVFRINQEVDPRLKDEAISDQMELIDSIRRCEGTLFCLAYIRELLMSKVNALAPDYNLFRYDRHGDVVVPLHIAVFKGLPEVTKMLLDSKGHTNVANGAGATAAHVAANTGSAECLKMLIECGADVNATTNETSMLSWSFEGELTVLRASSWPRYRFLCKENRTPLHMAAQRNHLQCVRLLLDHGANVNAMDSRQESPLYLAAREGHPECMMMMLQHSSNCPAVFTSTDTQGTVLLECFSHGEQMRECIKELVYREADVSRHNIYGVSAVHRAVDYNWNLDMMKLLILEGHGMDFDRAKRGSPLMMLMTRQLDHYRDVKEGNPIYINTDLQESTALLFLRMGATRKELKTLLWCELNLPKQPGVLLETLMDSFSYLPSLSELEAGLESKSLIESYLTPPYGFDEDECVCSGTLWHRLEAGMTGEARTQEEESLKAIVAEKKRHYHQRSREAPSLLHLSRAAIRSNLQADVRKVNSWPVPQCVKRYILLDHVQ